MSVFAGFVLPSELCAIVTDVCRRADLIAAVCLHDETRPHDDWLETIAPDDLFRDATTVNCKLYLIPRHVWDATEPRNPETINLRASIDIAMDYARAAPFDKVLTMTVLQAQNYVGGPQMAYRVRRALQTVGQIHFGVLGRNFVYGGEHAYKNDFYSAEALRLFEVGVQWKQFMDGNVEFAPL